MYDVKFVPLVGAAVHRRQLAPDIDFADLKNAKQRQLLLVILSAVRAVFFGGGRGGGKAAFLSVTLKFPLLTYYIFGFV